MLFSGVIDPIIGPNISPAQTTRPIIGERRSLAPGARLPVVAARRVEPRFEDSSVNSSLVIANIGDSVALHCNIWMKQVRSEGSKLATDWILFSFTPVRKRHTWPFIILTFFIIKLIRAFIILQYLLHYNIESVSTQHWHVLFVQNISD